MYFGVSEISMIENKRNESHAYFIMASEKRNITKASIITSARPFRLKGLKIYTAKAMRPIEAQLIVSRASIL